MLLYDIVTTSQRVAETSRKIAKIEALASCLRHLAPEEIEIAVAYLSGEMPQGKIGAGYAMLKEAMPERSAHAPTLSLIEVDRELGRIARVSGPGSAFDRKQLLTALLSRSTATEQSFLFRLLVGELRQGALQGLMAEAIAKAAELAAGDVRRAIMLAGVLGPVARVALSEGAPGLKQFSLRLFRPVQPMLAQPAQNIADALAQLGSAALEWKLDGARVQVHKSGGEVRVFTRSLNEVSAAVPEIVEAVQRLAPRELILDGEAIALTGDGTPHPFQVTMRRFGRKLDVEHKRQEVPLSVFLFDCLRLDADDLIQRPARERFEALSRSMPAELLIPRLITGDSQVADSFFTSALKQGHEGVMAKSLEATYEAGSRGGAWLKVKQAMTLDLVVLAAEWGHGRRSAWLSNLHLGARDPATGQFVMLGKTFKGMTDDLLAWQTEKLLSLELTRDSHTVYVKPELVVEIDFNELQASSQYPGGLALRFARVKRYRRDKKAEEADTIDAVRAIYARQLRTL